MKKKNIVLTGFRGCGKQEFGKLLGELTGLPFVDIDTEVEFILGESIPLFVDKYGWQVYREVEQKVAHDFCRNFSGIISTGEGTIENSKNLENLKKTGHFVFINPNFTEVKKRLLNEENPSLFPRLNPDIPISQEIDQLWQQRKSIYQAISDTEITPDLTQDIATETAKIEKILHAFLPKAPTQKKVAILASCEKSLFQNLVEAQKKGRIPNICFNVLITDTPQCTDIVFAKKEGVSLIEVLESTTQEPSEEYDRQILNILRKEHCDFVLLMGWGKNFSPLYSEQFGAITLNTYPSLLPKYASMSEEAVYSQVFENEDRYTGCTIYKINPKADIGENVLQRKILVEEGDSAELLQEKIKKQSVLAFCEVLERR